MNFPSTYCENLRPCKSTPEGYFQWSGSRTVKSTKQCNLVLNSTIKLF